MENFVGAKSVQSNEIFCKQCLINQGILYSTESQITHEEAFKQGLRCSKCKRLLYFDQKNEGYKRKKKVYN